VTDYVAKGVNAKWNGLLFKPYELLSGLWLLWFESLLREFEICAAKNDCAFHGCSLVI